MSGLKDKKLIKKSKPTQKLKHANSILEYFEYVCQMWSKLILIISSYTVSKFTRFWDTVYKSTTERHSTGGKLLSPPLLYQHYWVQVCTIQFNAWDAVFVHISTQCDSPSQWCSCRKNAIFTGVCLSLSVMIVMSMLLLDILPDGVWTRGLLVYINI